jgi:hypothetical protein
MRVEVDGLLVKVRDSAVLGRAGLLGVTSFTLMFLCRVSLPELKTSPSPTSRPSKKPGRSASAGAGFLASGDGSSGMRAGDRLFLRCWRRSEKLTGPAGRTRPSKVSSSLSAVMELDTLGLRADADELLLERPSLRVPPNLVPRLPSPQSRSSA